MEVIVQSFSYRDNPFATCTSDFVFDMRGIINLGTLFTMFNLTGKDTLVQAYLDKTKLPEYMNNVYNLVSSLIDIYLSNMYESPIVVSFGCIGGKHRSVYAAELMAKYITNKYAGVPVTIVHSNSARWK